MSFILVPSRLHIPSVPGITYGEDFFCGVYQDRGRYAFQTNLGHIIAESAAYWLDVDGEIYTPVFEEINKYIYWKNGDDYIYYSYVYGWIKADRIPGVDPVEYYDEEKGEYSGDMFWSGNIPQENIPEMFVPRGYNRNNRNPLTVKFYWPRWQSEEKFSEYWPNFDSEEVLHLGIPRWRELGSNVEYLRSINKIDGNYTYGTIYYSNGKWLIGVENSSEGWWEGEEPSTTHDVVFHFVTLDGASSPNADVMIAFDRYIQGNETLDVYLAEVAIWR